MEPDNRIFAPYGSIFDTHCHLDDPVFDPDREELLAAFPENGVGCVINNSTDLFASADRCLALAEKYPFCFTAVGLHPETVETEGAKLDEERLLRLLDMPKVVAVGEIGLDYHYSADRKELQKSVFRRECEIANLKGLPVIIHDRDAHGDTMDILRETRPKGTVHCFSGSPEMAEELVRLGLCIGVGGVVTFKNARRLVESVEAVPMENILVETDAPYCSPVPFRGKRCDPTLIVYTAEKIAEIKKTDVNSVLNAAAENARRVFGINAV